MELAAELEARFPALRVPFISGYGEKDAVDRARALPGVSFLGKPFVFEDLARTVRRSLDGAAADPG